MITSDETDHTTTRDRTERLAPEVRAGLSANSSKVISYAGSLIYPAYGASILLAICHRSAGISVNGSGEQPHRQGLQPVDQRARPPAQRLGRHPQPDRTEPLQQCAERDLRLQPGQRRAQAVVDAVPERQVP